MPSGAACLLRERVIEDSWQSADLMSGLSRPSTAQRWLKARKTCRDGGDKR